jgi:uncharacterized protein (DUF302 family)
LQEGQPVATKETVGAAHSYDHMCELIPAIRQENTSMTHVTNNGMINKPTNHSVDETVRKLKSILEAKGVGLFALIDHSGEAEKVGMK